MKNIWGRFKKILETLLLIFGVLGIGFIGGIAKPVYDNLPWVYRGAFEEKIESIKPTQSYEYIKSVLGEAQVSERFELPLENDGIEIGARNIWANDLYTMIGYFRNDESLYGYIMISQNKKFKPEIGSDFYNKNGFGKLMKTTFVDAHKKSNCYIDMVRGCYANSALLSSYYVELYDFSRSDFYYGVALTSLGVNRDKEFEEDMYELNTIPYFKMGTTTEEVRPENNSTYQKYREMKPNAMLLFNNRSEINAEKFFDVILEHKFSISYSDLRRLY